ncbi:HU family DNA-binding protein [Polynucleobacter sp. UK-Kesae-W10]|uniref:HU family DNA-binding protein n=1 Tax=Polynucleobacter sp. UK-Kesae-W10 TaxID=1819738 RepID=UPI001C0C842B|nr:HU family DNA-binding protein [Polynucleobacter sp. UK-Kesae-W10]MBU3577523.1 HU family DNA-binding protein [Polynucleobacter sp. UK-Kesae-W10]
MLKNDLIKRTAYVSGQTTETVRLVLTATAAVTRKAVSRGEEVMLFGLGKIKVAQRGEKRARNIRTGETVMVPPRNVVLLQASDALIQAANEN